MLPSWITEELLRRVTLQVMTVLNESGTLSTYGPPQVNTDGTMDFDMDDGEHSFTVTIGPLSS